jgi:hypothetical protein
MCSDVQTIFFCCIKHVANRNMRGSLYIVLVFSDFNRNCIVLTHFS